MEKCFFFLLRHLKLTYFRAVIAVTKHCETDIFAKGYQTNKISHRHKPNHERKFSITASLHLRVKLTRAEQSMFINMRERAYCIHSSLCRAELQTERYLKL